MLPPLEHNCLPSSMINFSLERQGKGARKKFDLPPSKDLATVMALTTHVALCTRIYLITKILYIQLPTYYFFPFRIIGFHHYIKVTYIFICAETLSLCEAVECELRNNLVRQIGYFSLWRILDNKKKSK